MEETSRVALDVLRSDEKLAWVTEQIIASFSEGIAQSAKESTSVVQSEFIDDMALTPREKTKREKYETSRPYDENEKLELIRFALEEVFVTLPSMQNASAKALHDLGSVALSIEFTAPDEEERLEGSYTRNVAQNVISVDDLKQRLEGFHKKLVP
jgi:hypothetical protein